MDGLYFLAWFSALNCCTVFLNWLSGVKQGQGVNFCGLTLHILLLDSTLGITVSNRFSLKSFKIPILSKTGADSQDRSFTNVIDLFLVIDPCNQVYSSDQPYF